MNFEKPGFLILVPAALLFCMYFFLRQRGSLRAVADNVAPRFFGSFTVYSLPVLLLHTLLIFLIISSLALTLAGPFRYDRTGTEGMVRGDVIIAVDSSFSMYANDIIRRKKEKEEVKNRFQQAVAIAEELLDKLKDYRIGLISFSGIAPIHAPPTTDHIAITEMLGHFRIHLFQETGSSFRKVFESLLHILHYKKEGFDVILIGDGELSASEDYSAELKLLAKGGVRIHSIGIGSEKGGWVNIFRPEDVKNNATKPRVAKEAKTKRETEHFEKFADATDSVAITIEDGDDPEKIIKALKNKPVQRNSGGASRKIPATAWSAGLFLLLFCLDIFLFADLAIFRFLRRHLQRGSVLLLITMLPLNCVGDLFRSYSANEDGRKALDSREPDNAIRHFEKSSAYNIRRHIPLYNLGNAYYSKEDFSAAHQNYESAQKESDEFADAYFNDGLALYRWGDKEFDRKKCVYDRTVQLWKLAVEKFSRSGEYYNPFSDERKLSDAHKRTILKKLADMKKECKTKGGGGGAGGKGSGGGEDKNKQQQQPQKQKQNNKGGGKQNQQGSEGDPEEGQEGRNQRKRPSKGSGNLSGGEKDQLEKARERISKSRGEKSFSQTGAQQLRKEKGKENIGPEILW